MARNQHDREDLIAEATALIDRIELQTRNEAGGDHDIVFAGFRKNGFLSIYFDQDLHYQFDHDGCLRRAYVDPYLYRASYGNLSQLKRQRADDQTILERTDLDTVQAREFVNSYQRRLRDLQSQLNSAQQNVLRFVLSDTNKTPHDFLNQLKQCLHTILNKTDNFFSRTIKGKRLK